jgi:hypothetical protein
LTINPAAEWVLERNNMSEPKYTIRPGDQIRLTRDQQGWRAAIAPKDGGFIGRAAGSHRTPEEALAEIKSDHEID